MFSCGERKRKHHRFQPRRKSGCIYARSEFFAERRVGGPRLFLHYELWIAAVETIRNTAG